MNSVPNGSTIVFPSGGKYLLGGNGIQLTSRKNLVLEGNGTTLRITGCTNFDSAFVLGGTTSGVTLRGFDVVGDNTRAGTSTSHSGSCEYGHGVLLWGASNIEIDDVNVSRVNGDCVYLGLGPSNVWASDVWYHDSRCELNGRQGLAVVAGKNLRAERLAFDKIAMTVLDIEPNDGLGGATDITFNNNTVGSYSLSTDYRSFFFGANGSHDALVNRIIVRDNLVTGGTLLTLVGDEWTGYSGQRNRRNITFTGNRSTVATTWGPVLKFKHVDGVTVTGNTQSVTSGGLATFTDSTGVTYVP